MFLSKICARKSGVLLYGITPPKLHTTPERIEAIASRITLTAALHDIDALVVYDVQDESARTSEERPFPFVSSIDPFTYASRYLKALPVPKIIYRPAGMFWREELSAWLDDLHNQGFHPVFVGLPSPDAVPKTSLTEAYELWRAASGGRSVLGAVTIPERHAVLKDEDARILQKRNAGVSFFVSQCVFDVGFARQMLADLRSTCAVQNEDIPVMIFTLTICGSAKTLGFMEWLGIYVPDELKVRIRESANPAACSLEIATSIAEELMLFCMSSGIPFGFNIESVGTKREEVEASLELLSRVNSLLCSRGFRGAQPAVRSIQTHSDSGI